jgi:hypothetical protein
VQLSLSRGNATRGYLGQKLANRGKSNEPQKQQGPLLLYSYDFLPTKDVDRHWSSQLELSLPAMQILVTAVLVSFQQARRRR